VGRVAGTSPWGVLAETGAGGLLATSGTGADSSTGKDAVGIGAGGKVSSSTRDTSGKVATVASAALSATTASHAQEQKYPIYPSTYCIKKF
jgi:hypothetical protein